MKKTLIAASLALTSFSTVASNYYVVVPFAEKAKAVMAATSVSLSAYSLPDATVGTPYPVFDFKNLLSVSGDPAYSPSQVQWSVDAGSLPAGLTLSAAGVLSGTPSAAGSETFAVKATYKTKAGVQTYTVTANLAVNFSTNVASLDFGSLPVGESSSKSVSVSNIGSAELTLSGYTVPAGYTASGNCTSVAPGASCQVNVSFTPTAQQNYLGNLTLTAQGYTGSKQVSLVGSGSAPSFAILDAGTMTRAGGITLSADKLTASPATTNATVIAASKPKASGKWYFEGRMATGTAGNCGYGLLPTASLSALPGRVDGISETGASYAIYSDGGATQLNKSTYAVVDWQGTSIQGSWVGIAYDLDNMTVKFILPTRTIGPFSLNKPAGTSYVPALSTWNSCTMQVNFGQTPFQRTVPSGYNAGLF